MKFKVLSKILSFSFLALGSVGMVSCDNHDVVNKDFDYERLYSNKRDIPYEVKNYDTIFAAYGYYLNTTQGYNNWYYLENENELAFDEESDSFSGNNVTFKDGLIDLKNSNFKYKYIIQKKGIISLFGNLKLNKIENKLILNIYKKSELLKTFSYNNITNESFYIELNDINVNENDEIIFEFVGEGKIEFNPGVTYIDSMNSSLYHKTCTKHLYGDVFPYYDEKTETLYNGFLWTDDARNGKYNFALEKSSNLLKFSDVPQSTSLDEWNKYENEYNLSRIRNVGSYIDLEKYNLLRDNFLYFDEENNRYLLIGGCYYSFDSFSQTSDLVIYESNDEIGFDWNKNGNVISGTYSRNLPECPSLMKIGNRWYPFVSVAYITAHQVGQLQYWIGEENVDCMDMKYNKDEYYYLDGEDLCAARVTKIKDKVYMWGWIPSTYDTMPWAPWGGYLNLPREVIQREDGTLGGRLDPGLTNLLNYGNVYTLEEDNFIIKSENTTFDGKNLKGNENEVFLFDNCQRDYVEIDLKNVDSEYFGLKFSNGDDVYLLKIYHDGDKQYMSVESPNDQKHKINSFLEIDKKINTFKIKIVHDGSFFEFFINDEYALTANTAMKSDQKYDLSLFSSNELIIDNLKVNKLIPYDAIEG